MSDAYNRLKFRVWNNAENSYMTSFAFTGTVYNNGTFCPFGNACENLAVEQCTGLHDVDGRLIYEGDIIAGEDPYCSHLVEWDDKEAMFYVVLLPTTKITTIRGTIRKDWIDEFQKRVIGNIHENPELLEDKK